MTTTQIAEMIFKYLASRCLGVSGEQFNGSLPADGLTKAKVQAKFPTLTNAQIDAGFAFLVTQEDVFYHNGTYGNGQWTNVRPGYYIEKKWWAYPADFIQAHPEKGGAWGPLINRYSTFAYNNPNVSEAAYLAGADASGNYGGWTNQIYGPSFVPPDYANVPFLSDVAFQAEKIKFGRV